MTTAITVESRIIPQIHALDLKIPVAGWFGGSILYPELKTQTCILISTVSLSKKATFCDSTTGFHAKWCLRNDYRNNILMTCHTTHIWVVLLIGWRKFPCLFQKFVARRDLPPAQALLRLSVGHGTSKKRESWRQARSAITMISARLWRPAVLVKTRVWVGCLVSRSHKTGLGHSLYLRIFWVTAFPSHLWLLLSSP